MKAAMTPDHPVCRRISPVAKWWLSVGIVVLLLGALQIRETNHRFFVQDEYERRREAQFQSDKNAVRELDEIRKDLWEKTQSRDLPFDDFRAALDREVSASVARFPGTRCFLYTNPETGGQAEISVHDGIVESVSTPLRFANGLPRTSQFMSILRRVAYLAGYVIWGLMLIAYPIRGTPFRRRQHAHALLAVAIGAAILAFLGPQYWRNWPFLFEDDSPAWAYPMIAVSVLLALYGHRITQRSDDPKCDECGYNLTGNVSGTCPECGNPVSRLAKK